MVLTNFDGVAFNVPEWAFLHNDSDPNSTPIDVTGVLNINGLAVSHTPGAGTNGFITIDDEDAANGGSFDYTISNGTLSDTAGVSVSNLNGGGDITGTSASEILVGDGNSNTFNGAGEGDVILAGAGNDTLIGGGAPTICKETPAPTTSATMQRLRVARSSISSAPIISSTSAPPMVT